MIIEFCGLPGSGKTSLANLLYKKNKSIIITNKNIEKEALKEKKLLSRYILYLQAIANTIYTTNKNINIKHFKYRQLKHITKYFKYSYWLSKDIILYKSFTETKKTILFEEGIIQHIALIQTFFPKTTPFIPPLKIYPMLFYLKLPPKEAMQRAVKRGLPYSWPSVKNLNEIFLSFESQLNHSIERLTKYYKTIITINALNSLENNFKIITETIKNFKR